MEIKNNLKIGLTWIKNILSKVTGSFLKKSEVSQKVDVNFKAFKVLGGITIVIFIAVIFIMPTEVPVEFAEKIDHQSANATSSNDRAESKNTHGPAEALWGSPKMTLPSTSGSSQVNYNAPMVIGSKGGNAKTELRAGIRLPLRMLDKVVVSQDPVPVLAELILNSESDSGLKIPAGTRFYGEASFQKGSDRATIRFSQISLPSGQIKKISALALSKDGQPGVVGRIFSDGIKNTTGQVITTFVGGLAAGSMETDMLGRSKGGIENGLLGAVAATAQGRAQVYGEKLKTEREWIELNTGIECDAVLNDSFKLQEGGGNYE
ncbi:MAG: hypothetical protein B7Y39_01870 [Bdellovibrio sp. 28-41-41]|nr:MAG: hypothetical protein B7Y39_01870 [Bdellovibrio sp. 28-41-41]